MAVPLSLSILLSAWTFEPSVLVSLLLVGLFYAAGLRELARRDRLWHRVARRHVVFFALGLASVFVALESPLDTFDGRLFAIHMTQHMLLLMVAPPVLLLGKPIPVLLVGAPRPLVRYVARTHVRTPWLHGLTRRLTAPLVAWPLYVGDLALWHVPALYQATLTNPGIHLLEHLCFFGTGILFWWVIVHPLPGPPRVRRGARLLHAWAAVVPNIALGVLLMVARTPWYPSYAAGPRLFGLSAMADQHLGGLIMWLPGGLMHVAAASVLAFATVPRAAPTMVPRGMARRARGT